MKHMKKKGHIARRADNHLRHMNLVLRKRRAKEKRAKQARKINYK